MRRSKSTADTKSRILPFIVARGTPRANPNAALETLLLQAFRRLTPERRKTCLLLAENSAIESERDRANGRNSEPIVID